jgi:hypothetical protein
MLRVAVSLLLVMLCAISVSRADDGPTTQLYNDGVIALRGWRSTSGGAWANICARSVTGKTIGEVIVDLHFVDSFGTVLDTTRAMLRITEPEGELCYKGPVPVKARDFHRIQPRLINYKLGTP